MSYLETMDRLSSDYELLVGMGFEVVGVFLQGSQNYLLDYENSDIDTKAIVLPKFEDFVLNKPPVSTTHILPNNAHIDIKDIRTMFDCFKKQNINFIEILFTKYQKFNKKYKYLFQPLIDNREIIARYNNYASINCIAGMSLEKYKALKHPYPNLVDKIEKYGYDAKQLSHIIRLNEFIKNYIDGKPYADCLISNQRNYIIDVKRFMYPLDIAEKIAFELMTETVDIKTKYMMTHSVSINKEAENLLKDVLLNIMKYNFKTELGV